MNINEIKKLLDAFYCGDTTLEQEDMLLIYFSGDEIANELEEEKELFLGFHDAQAINIPVSLTPKIDILFDTIASKEQIDKKKQGRHYLFIIASAIAAMLLGAIFFIDFDSGEQSPNNKLAIVEETLDHLPTPPTMDEAKVSNQVAEVVEQPKTKAPIIKLKEQNTVKVVAKANIEEQTKQQQVKEAMEAITLFAECFNSSIDHVEEASSIISNSLKTRIN